MLRCEYRRHPQYTESQRSPLQLSLDCIRCHVHPCGQQGKVRSGGGMLSKCWPRLCWLKCSLIYLFINIYTVPVHVGKQAQGGIHQKHQNNIAYRIIKAEIDQTLGPSKNKCLQVLPKGLERWCLADFKGRARMQQQRHLLPSSFLLSVLQTMVGCREGPGSPADQSAWADTC